MSGIPLKNFLTILAGGSCIPIVEGIFNTHINLNNFILFFSGGLLGLTLSDGKT